MTEEEARRKRAKDLDDNGVVNLIGGIFAELKKDYIASLKYIDAHKDDDPYADPAQSKKLKKAIKIKKGCEEFTKSPLYLSITDYDGQSLLRDFRREM